MSEAYSIMSPSFTRPKHVRRSSLSSVSAKAVESVDSAPDQTSPKSKMIRTSDVDTPTRKYLKPVERHSTVRIAQSAQSGAVISDDEEVENAKARLLRKLDIKILVDLLSGKYELSSESHKNFRRFLKTTNGVMDEANASAISVDDDSSLDSGDTTETEDEEVVPRQVGPANGTLVRTELRPRQQFIGRAAPKRSVRR